jgi:hypothetical protein
METAQDLTRLRAATALELILAREHGFVAGQGFPGPGAEDRVREVWTANGSYDYEGTVSARARSVALWRAWLDGRAHRTSAES